MRVAVREEGGGRVTGAVGWDQGEGGPPPGLRAWPRRKRGGW